MKNPDRLLPRTYDSTGQLKMAESRAEAQRQDITPIPDLFLVHHYDPPAADFADPVTFVEEGGSTRSIDVETLRSLPSRTLTAVLECAGNGRAQLSPRAPGNQFGLGLSGQVVCTGVSVVDVLQHLGLSVDGWTTLVATAPDNGVTPPEDKHADFAKGLPREKALNPDTMLVWEMNGEPIPLEHGGPIRLVVPGWYGIWWVKWVQRVELTSSDFTGFWQNERYTYQAADGSVLAVVQEQLPRALLLEPQQGDRIDGSTELRIRAWSGGSPVAAVHFSVDDGENWSAAERVSDDGRWSWQTWTGEFPAGLPRGLRRIAVRATDESGRTQDWSPQANRLGYGNNGMHVVEIDLVAPAP